MFNIRDEGELIKQGFNFYPLNSSQIGIVLRIKNKFFAIRYSKVLKRWRVIL